MEYFKKKACLLFVFPYGKDHALIKTKPNTVYLY